MSELWKPVWGYEGRYQVSNLGRVRGPRGRVLKPYPNRDGYLRVRLCAAGMQRDRYVHRLVAQTFIPNPLHLPEVDHGDDDKTNNAASNLEWVTRLENMQRAEAHGLLTQPDNRGERNGQAVLTESDVRAIRAAPGLYKDIGKTFGVCRELVGHIKRGDRWGHVL